LDQKPLNNLHKDYASQLEELDDLRKKVDDFGDSWQQNVQNLRIIKHITRSDTKIKLPDPQKISGYSR
jgi:hypothetical protein